MAKRLTEEMVIARTKISDMSKIKRMNVWGCELVDVSLLRRMPNVEVLSLSINKINSLEDFGQCKRLEELYIRQNDIRDLNQVCYLQNLPNLKNLWLGENPCAGVDGYRSAVIRALPNLQKLDNIPVTPEEVKEAQRKGKALYHPDDPQESEEEEYVSSPQYTKSNNRFSDYEPEYQTHTSPQRSPVKEPDYETEEVEEYYVKEEPVEDVSEYSPPLQPSPPSHRQEPIRRSYSPEPEYIERRRNSYDRESPKQNSQYYDRSPASNNTNEDPSENFRELRIVNSHSSSSIKQEYTNGYYQQPVRQNDNNEEVNHREDNQRGRYVCPASHRPPFNRRPVTRNSNILSAVLCLVKELDYPSLEVVEMAVRCRMDEIVE